jgi:hypothetical protein
MLSLEVVGPGDGLSTVLSATPFWRDVSWSVSWQAAMATGQWRCLLFGWGTAGGGDGGAALVFDGNGLKICDRCIIGLLLYSAFFILV